jgi:transposase
MEKAAIIGLDIAKQVFQVHGINKVGAIVCRRRLRRDDVVAFFKALPPSLMGIEACATEHHWARVLMADSLRKRLVAEAFAWRRIKPLTHIQGCGLRSARTGQWRNRD